MFILLNNDEGKIVLIHMTGKSFCSWNVLEELSALVRNKKIKILIFYML